MKNYGYKANWINSFLLLEFIIHKKPEQEEELRFDYIVVKLIHDIPLNQKIYYHKQSLSVIDNNIAKS